MSPILTVLLILAIGYLWLEVKRLQVKEDGEELIKKREVIKGLRINKTQRNHEEDK